MSAINWFKKSVTEFGKNIQALAVPDEEAKAAREAKRLALHAERKYKRHKAEHEERQKQLLEKKAKIDRDLLDALMNLKRWPASDFKEVGKYPGYWEYDVWREEFLGSTKLSLDDFQTYIVKSEQMESGEALEGYKNLSLTAGNYHPIFMPLENKKVRIDYYAKKVPVEYHAENTPDLHNFGTFDTYFQWPSLLVGLELAGTPQTTVSSAATVPATISLIRNHDDTFGPFHCNTGNPKEDQLSMQLSNCGDLSTTNSLQTAPLSAASGIYSASHGVQSYSPLDGP